MDNQGNPVPNASLTFTAPDIGASAFFEDTQTNSSSVVTDANGVAVTPLLKANGQEGYFMVTASLDGSSLSEVFSLSNSSAPLSPDVLTYNAFSSSSLPGILLCSGGTASCTNGGLPQADTAHRYAIGTYNFYFDRYARESIDGKNMTIISSINYCRSNLYYCPYDNAFWNGDQMVYGSKYGFSQADDIVAHELTHGVTRTGI